MSKLKMHTPDFTNVARLAELFPNCVTETKDEKGAIRGSIDFDQLRQELSDKVVEGPRERYQLDWPGKRAALLVANAPVAKTLRPNRKASISFDLTKHLFVEGDNLDALKLLQETYLNKVKMIYIDPPYNTGNDFIYKDNFSVNSGEYLTQSGQVEDSGERLVANPESNGRFHSDWLSMMYPRLKLARNLLRPDGVLFVSIDDKELATLRLIGDEVFGNANYLATFVRKRRMSTGMRGDAVSPDHEYIAAFCRSRDAVKLYGAERDESDYPFSDNVGKYRSTDLTVGMTREMRPNQYYPIKNPRTGKEYMPPETRVWRFFPATMQKEIAAGNIIWPDDEPDRRMSRPRYKTRYLPDDEDASAIPVSTWIASPSEADANENSADEEVLHLSAGMNQEATKELRELMSEQVLEYPKPVSLLRALVTLATRDSDIVLDFFAGASSTAQAVLEQNSDDGGARRFIMVQLPELVEEDTPAARLGFKTISEISMERIRRAGKNLKEAAGLNGDKIDIGFRVLKVDTSNMKDVYYQADAVTQPTLAGLVDNVKEDRTDEDLLFQVLLDWGVDLTLPIKPENIIGKTVYFVDTDALAACFQLGIDEAFIKELAKRKPLRAVFRDTGYGSDATKINVEQIFKLLSPATEVKSI